MRNAEHLILLGGTSSASGSSGTAPSNTAAPNATGSTAVGSVLTTDNGTWVGTAPITYSYQWVSGTTNVGTNSNTYTTVSGDTNALVYCVVTANNSFGSASQASNSIGPIGSGGTQSEPIPIIF